MNEPLDDLIQRALEGEVTADERTRLEAQGVEAPAPAAVAAPGGEGNVRFRIVERAGDPPPGGLHGQ